MQPRHTGLDPKRSWVAVKIGLQFDDAGCEGSARGDDRKARRMSILVRHVAEPERPVRQPKRLGIGAFLHEHEIGPP